ncbi:MAG: 16S rRNA (guanine(527)-N(7))-methyltransferase RsmG [Terriglobales bacterium]
MDAKEISQLLVPFVPAPGLNAKQLNHISMYIDILLRWNRKMNLTAVREPEEIVRRHFGESLFAARHLFAERPDPTMRVIDVGSGAGVPGLPLKIYAPAVHLTLIESHSRKAAFLREVIRALKLTNAEVFAARAEEFQGRAELVTLRAVEKFERALPVAARLVEPGGRIALLIGVRQVELARQALPDLVWNLPQSIPESAERVLLVGGTRKGKNRL